MGVPPKCCFKPFAQAGSKPDDFLFHEYLQNVETEILVAGDER